MKLFVGGYALGVILISWWAMEKARVNIGRAAIAGILFGWIFGLAVWGLL